MGLVVSWSLVFAVGGIGLWLISFIVEAMRPKPRPPAKLRWQPNIPIDTLEVRGNKIRYIKAGTGRTLVLLHTLRTQLDLFEKVVPDLSKRFTVYALDYLGHGYSDIPSTLYDAAFFTATVEEFLEKLDLHEVTLAGISIGGAISLIIAARHNPRVARVVAINPYDYAKGRGMARSSFFGRIVTYASLVPIVGETAMRLRSFPLMKAVLRGGVAQANSISRELQKEMYLVGNRPGHYRAFLNLLRNAESWEIASKEYGRINVPVLLVWGDKDWARSSEREHDRRLIPGVQMETVKGGGHFLSLDTPQELRDLIIRFAG